MEISSDRIKLARLFYKRSKMDLGVAEELLKSEYWSDSAYHSQQAGEKAVKAILVLQDVIVRDHIVSAIFGRIIHDEDIEMRLKDLERHWIKPRYPLPPRTSDEDFWDPTESYSKGIAENALEKAKFIFNWAENYAKERYNVDIERIKSES